VPLAAQVGTVEIAHEQGVYPAFFDSGVFNGPVSGFTHKIMQGALRKTTHAGFADAND
jgi:hypothetical protein